MRYTAIVFLALSLLTAVSCRQSSPSASRNDAVIIATVTETGNTPEPGKKIALVELRDTMITDANGQVTFVVLPGMYTVRAFDLNHGGPMRLTMDSTATVRAGDTARIAFWDCPTCL